MDASVTRLNVAVQNVQQAQSQSQSQNIPMMLDDV